MLKMIVPALIALAPLTAENAPALDIVQTETVPQYLYKVVTTENWAFNKEDMTLKLTENDKAFIHFSKEDQLEKTISKHFKDVAEYAVLKIDTAKLPGKLVYEANTAGSNKYYHLYEGAIPHDAVVDAQVIKN